MTLRKEVEELVKIGKLPDSDYATVEWLMRWGGALDAISGPVTEAEALALMQLFGPDDCFGAVWKLLHLIETCPAGVPINSKPSPDANEWVQLLWDRSHRE